MLIGQSYEENGVRSQELAEKSTGTKIFQRLAASLKKKKQQGSIETQRFIPAYERKGQSSIKVRNRELYALAVLSEQKPELSKMFQASSGRCKEASNIPRSCHLQIKKSIRNIIPENKYKFTSELVQQKKKKKDKDKDICQLR